MNYGEFSWLCLCKTVHRNLSAEVARTIKWQVTSFHWPFESKLHHKGNTSVAKFTDIFLEFMLCGTMKATLLLHYFVLLSCVSLLVKAKSIKSKHGKCIIIGHFGQRKWNELSRFWIYSCLFLMIGLFAFTCYSFLMDTLLFFPKIIWNVRLAQTTKGSTFLTWR